MKFPNVPSTSVKLMLFPFSLEGAARIWLEKEPPRSILTWDDLVSKFINQFFPPSKTTNLRNEITNFQQRFDESFYEAWDRFNDLLRACPHHGFSELHQLDTFYNALNSNDQDSLNSAAGGNFLDKMPRDCLRIIESKSKVRHSRSKAIVSKVGTSSSTPGVPPDVSELKDMVKALLLDKKNQSQAPATVKAVEESCVTCGGAHSYRNCPATDGNVYRDNIQEYASQAAAVNYNQGNTGYRPPMVANQIRPPGFPPVQQNQGNNQNRYNQNRGNNFNQGPIYRPPVNQPPAYQAPAYQAPAPQTQGVSKEDFQNYIKANDAVMKNMQNQNQNMQNQMTNLTNLLTNFVNSNTASTSGSGSLPSNTIANPKGDIKAITTRSGVSYKGPTIPPPPSSLPKVVERETEVTKDTVPPTNNGSTEDVQPPVVQVETHVPIFEPVVALVSAPKPNPKPSIPYPSRHNDQKIREKANNQIEKWLVKFTLHQNSGLISWINSLICYFYSRTELAAMGNLLSYVLPLAIFLRQLSPCCCMHPGSYNSLYANEEEKEFNNWRVKTPKLAPENLKDGSARAGRARGVMFPRSSLFPSLVVISFVLVLLSKSNSMTSLPRQERILSRNRITVVVTLLDEESDFHLLENDLEYHFYFEASQVDTYAVNMNV
ncbi:reverse transcriptase domain-containing protein [Tanacetum coccineum]